MRPASPRLPARHADLPPRAPGLAVRAVLALALAALAAPPPARAQTNGRTISGALLYREKMALPDDAEMVVELRSPDGRLVARLRRATEGAQIPLVYSLQGPSGAPLMLRAALFENTRMLWASAPVALRGGRGRLAAPPLMLSRIEAASFATPLTCGTARAEIAPVPGGAWLKAGGSSWQLTPDPKAPARLRAEKDAGVWVETLDNRSTIHLPDTTLKDCAPGIPPALFPFKAAGRDPDWQLEMARGRLILTRPQGAKLAAPLPEPVHEDADSLRFDLPDQKLTVTLARKLCHDRANGMPRPLTITVTAGDQVLHGCGGAPLTLLQGPAWTITRAGASDIARIGAEGGFDEGKAPEISFLGNQASGRSGCNRFSARVLLGKAAGGDSSGNGSGGLHFGPIAATKMTCKTLQMTAEEAVFNALGAADGFDLVGGELQLLARGKVVLVAKRK